MLTRGKLIYETMGLFNKQQHSKYKTHLKQWAVCDLLNIFMGHPHDFHFLAFTLNTVIQVYCLYIVLGQVYTEVYMITDGWIVHIRVVLWKKLTISKCVEAPKWLHKQLFQYKSWSENSHLSYYLYYKVFLKTSQVCTELSIYLTLLSVYLQ